MNNYTMSFAYWMSCSAVLAHIFMNSFYVDSCSIGFHISPPYDIPSSFIVLSIACSKFTEIKISFLPLFLEDFLNNRSN